MRIAIVILVLWMAFPAAAQIELRRTRADHSLRDFYALRESATKFVDFMLDGDVRDDCVVPERDYRDDPATTLCIFDELYRDTQVFYIRTYDRDILLIRDGDVVAFSPVWHSYAYLVMIDIPPGEYVVLLHAISRHKDPQELVFKFEVPQPVTVALASESEG